MWQGSLRAARAPLEEAIAILKEHDGADGKLVLALVWYGGTRYDDAAAALGAVREAESLARATARDWLLGIILIGAANVEKRHLGNTDRARALLDEAERLYRRLDDPRELAYALMERGGLDELAGEHRAARARFEEVLALARALGNPAFTATALQRLGGQALFVEGDAPRACALFAEALPLARDAALPQVIAGIFEGIAEAAVRRGRAREAARLYTAADAIWQRLGGVQPSVSLETRARQTIESARAALGEEAFAVAWAEGQALSQEQGIAEALALANELASLAAVSHPQDGPADTDALTAREVEVLRLIAAGKSNAEIAEELVLSIRTVERHISTIYGKLGAHGGAARAAVVSYALTHHLLDA